MKTNLGKKIASFIIAATAAVCSLTMIACSSEVSAFHKHRYSYTYNDDATCGQDGTETGKCKYCDKTDTRVKKGTATGYHYYVGYCCSVCGEYAPNAPVNYELQFMNIGYAYEVKGMGSCTSAEILIPNKIDGLPVTSIGWRAFENCGGVTKIVIPNTVTHIDMSAFYKCDNLREVVMTDSVTEIESSAFDGCKKLTTVTLPKNLTTIESMTFWNCESLTSITIPNSVTEIGLSAFYKCTGLRSVTIPRSVTTIKSSAFDGCTGLTTVKIPNSVTKIESDAFYKCDKLTVYCEANSMPSGWDSKWNYIGYQWSGSNLVDAYCGVVYGQPMS